MIPQPCLECERERLEEQTRLTVVKAKLTDLEVKVGLASQQLDPERTARIRAHFNRKQPSLDQLAEQAAKFASSENDEQFLRPARYWIQQVRPLLKQFIAATQAQCEHEHDRMLSWRSLNRDLDDVCKPCGGSGMQTYANTSTWRGGIGGNAMRTAVCDQCWGSGDASKPWPSWREREAQREQLENWKTLGDSVQAEAKIHEEQFATIAAELNLPPNEDQGGWPGPHNAFSIIAALRQQLSQVTKERDGIRREEAARCQHLNEEITRIAKERDEAVGRETHLAQQLGIVYDYITDGELSKPYDFEGAIRAVVDDAITAQCRAFADEEHGALQQQITTLRETHDRRVQEIDESRALAEKNLSITEAQVFTLHQEVEKRVHVGAQMANLCFNLGQRLGVSIGPRDAEVMRNLQKQWDAIGKSKQKASVTP